MATNQPAPHDWNVRATVEPFRSSEHPTMAFLDISWTDKINGDKPWLRSQRVEILPIPVAQAIADALAALPAAGPAGMDAELTFLLNLVGGISDNENRVFGKKCLDRIINALSVEAHAPAHGVAP